MISHREVTPRVMFPHHSTNHLGHPHDDPTLTLIAGIAEAAVAEVSSRPRSRGGQVTVDEGTMTELQEHQHDTSISRPHSSPNRPRNDPPRSASPFNPTSELSFERQRPKTSGGHGVRGNASMSPDAGREARGGKGGRPRTSPSRSPEGRRRYERNASPSRSERKTNGLTESPHAEEVRFITSLSRESMNRLLLWMHTSSAPWHNASGQLR